MTTESEETISSTTSSEGGDGILGKFSKATLAGIGCCVFPAVLVIVLGLAGFLYFNGIHNDGVKKEAALGAQYQDNQNELSAQTLKIKESLGVAQVKSDALDKVLTDAVVGRYNQSNSPQPDSGKLFSAIKEAYPDLSGLNTFDRVIDIINSGREAYKNKQTKLLTMVQEYKTWLRTGLLKQQMVSLSGFPSSGLEARVGNKVVTGQAALDQIETIILDADTQGAYTSGTQAPLVTTKK